MTPAKRRGRSEASDFLDNFSEFLGESEGQDLNELVSELREEGIDVNAFVTKVKGMIAVKLAETKRSWITEAKAGRAAAIAKMKEYEPEIPKDAHALIEKIRQIISGGEGREIANAYFRNLKDMPYEDLKKLYEDYLKLQYLTKENENEGHDSR